MKIKRNKIRVDVSRSVQSTPSSPHAVRKQHSLHLFLLLLFASTASSTCTSPVPQLGCKYSSFGDGCLRREAFQEYAQLPSHTHLWTSSRGSGQGRRRPPLFPSACVIHRFPGPPNTSYFEVEFLHLCLRGKTENRLAKPCLVGQTWKKEWRLVTVCVLGGGGGGSLPHNSPLCLLSGWVLILTWPSLRSLRHTPLACETCNAQNKRSSFRYYLTC